MDQMVKVSVIMLTYNREALVGRAIESILAQTMEDFEYIIVDNGSTDKSGEIAEEYAKKDSRIRVLHIPKSNIGTGRNAGLDVAKGEYVTFIDDDDWVEEDFLEFLLVQAIENDADVSICGAFGKEFDEKKIMTAEEAVLELFRRKRYNAAFPTKMFRREMSDELRFPKAGAFDDIALMYKLLAYANRVVYYGLPKYTFYRHESNNSAWTTNHSLLNASILDEYLESYRTRTEWLSERFPECAGEFRYFEWSFMISMVEKINRLNINDCERQLARMVTELRRNREEFLASSELCVFEKEWMEKYIR